MAFKPNVPKLENSVPYFDDVTSTEGWQGQTTGKSIAQLKSEITSAISRMGGLVSAFIEGADDSLVIDGEKVIRYGYQIHYSIEDVTGKMMPGQIDIVALPVRNDIRLRRSYETRKQQSLKMALYMFAISTNGLWFMEKLSPGYSGLMPFMLADKNRTISQLWVEGVKLGNLLPPPSDIDSNTTIEGKFQEIK